MTGPKGIVASAVSLMLIAGLPGPAPTGHAQDLRTPQTVRVDFMAMSKDGSGSQVTNLKLEEVTLRIDGKIRPLRTLQYVQMSEGLNSSALAVNAATGGAGTPALPAPAPEIEAPFAQNLVPAVSLSRSIVLIVDDETMPIGQEQTLRRALVNFVRSLPENDQVALVTAPRGRVEVPMTKDREQLAKAIALIQPITPNDDAACRSRTMIGALQTTMTRMMAQRAPDQPMVVAFLSSTLNGISVQEQAQRATIGGGGGVSSQAGACVIRPDDFERVGQAQAAARAQFYVIHPDYSPAPAAGGIEDLRSRTNAPLLHLTSSGEQGLIRMARETTGYYLATFDTEPDELVGKPHNSKVQTTRKDVEIRDRPWLIVGKDTPALSNASRDPSLGPVTSAYDMVRSGRHFRDLSLRGTAWTTRSTTEGKVLVIGVFEPVDVNTKIMQAAAALFDEEGRAWDYWTTDMAAMREITSFPTTIGLTVRPGKYRLRIAAIDDKGRTGLIDYAVDADLAKAGPFQVGGLSLSVSRPTGFQPRMLFTTEAAAIAMFDLYGVFTDETKVSAVFEIAKTKDGPAIYQAVTATASPTKEEGKLVVTGTIPVGALAPGDYVIRAVVTVPGQGSARVLRTLRKS